MNLLRNKITSSLVLTTLIFGLANCSSRPKSDAATVQLDESNQALQKTLYEDPITDTGIKTTFDVNPEGTQEALSQYNMKNKYKRPNLSQFLYFFLQNSSQFGGMGDDGQNLIRMLFTLFKYKKTTNPGTPSTPDEPELPAPPPATPCGLIPSGGILNSNMVVKSCNGAYEVQMQGAGNLVVYQVGGKILFSSNTYPSAGAYAAMQTDGNFVVYSQTRTGLFWTSTNGNPGAKMYMQDDGNLVIYATNGTALWNSYAAAAAQQPPAGTAASSVTRKCYVDFLFGGILYNTSANPGSSTAATAGDADIACCYKAVTGIHQYFKGNVQTRPGGCHSY